MTQRHEILKALRKGRRLTPLAALRLCGTLSLSQRIGELKRKGFNIVRRMVEVGKGKHVAEYKLLRNSEAGKGRVA